MAHSRRLLLLVVLLAALCGFAAAKESETTKESNKQDESPAVPSSSSVPISPRRMRGLAATRSGGSSPTARTEQAPPPSPAVADTPNYEQQVLVVKGNPSPEKLNDEIRKAIRALLGPDGDKVQIRELKDANELRRIAPGARPIGVQLVQ